MVGVEGQRPVGHLHGLAEDVPNGLFTDATLEQKSFGKLLTGTDFNFSKCRAGGGGGLMVNRAGFEPGGPGFSSTYLQTLL